MLRQLTLEDMDSAAGVHRRSFDQALPTLAGLHTPEEDRWFFKERVFAACRIWGYFEDTVLIGFIAFRDVGLTNFMYCHHRRAKELVLLCCRWPKAGQIASASGRSNGTKAPAGFMRSMASCLSKRRMVLGTKRRNRMPCIHGGTATLKIEGLLGCLSSRLMSVLV
jgi:hypothetical protein